MDNSVITAIITASSTSLVAIVALLMNNKRFDDINSRISGVNDRISELKSDMNIRFGEMDGRMTRLENKTEHIEQLLVSALTDNARIKEHLGMK